MALGAGVVLVATLLGRLPAWDRNLGAFQGLYLAGFAFYALALLGLRRWGDLPRVGWIVVAVAIAARAAVLPAAPSLSDDVYRYVWEGRVLLAAEDPYRLAPASPELAALRDEAVFPRINHPELATVYPPLALAGFALVAALSPTVAAMKLWVALHDLALVLVLIAWLRRRGRSPAAAIAYAWHPLPLVEFAGSGHHDPTAIVWLALALVLADRRPVAAALALAAGAMVKLAPAVALPFLLPRWPWRVRALAIVLVAGGLAGYLALARHPDSGLAAYWETWRNNQLGFHYLERWTGSFARARLVALALAALLLALALWSGWSAMRATRFAARLAVVLGPVVHPWYLAWELFQQPFHRSAPWLALSLTVVLSYGLLAPPAAGRSFHLPLAWRWVEYGAPLALALGLWAARLRPLRRPR